MTKWDYCSKWTFQGERNRKTRYKAFVENKIC